MKTTTFGGGPGKVQPIRREIKYIVHFLCLPLCPLGCKENERRVVLRHTTTEKAPVPLGPSDYPVFMPFRVLLEAVGILKTRGFYAPTGCSNSENSLFGIFSGAQQIPMGNPKILPLQVVIR